jgi:predicted acylesterase/phospholipase RssA
VAEPDVLPEFDPRWTEAVLAEFDPPVDAAGKDALRWFLDRIRPYLKQGMESNPSLIERGNWQKVLERHVNWKRLNGDQARCYLGCTATDVETGTLAWFWNHAPPNPAPAPLLKDAGLWVQHAMASSSIWSIYPSTVVDDRWYWDGALLANTPVRPAIDLLLAGETDLDVVVVLMTPFFEGPPGLPVDKQPSVLDGLVRFMDWMMLGTFREQLARLDVAQRERVRIVAPNRFQGVVQMIDYAPGEMDALRRQGEEDAHHVLDR